MNSYEQPSPRSRLDERGADRRLHTRAVGPLGTAARLGVGAAFVLLGLLLNGDGIEWTTLLLGFAAFPAVLGLVQLLRLSSSSAPLRATGPLAFCVNLGVLGVLLIAPPTSHPTLVFLGVSMLVAAWRGYAGCESLAISNWVLRRNDQVGCVLFWPVDELETRLRAALQRPENSRTESGAAVEPIPARRERSTKSVLPGPRGFQARRLCDPPRPARLQPHPMRTRHVGACLGVGAAVVLADVFLF